jgi:hypothetical protein
VSLGGAGAWQHTLEVAPAQGSTERTQDKVPLCPAEKMVHSLDYSYSDYMQHKQVAQELLNLISVLNMTRE